SIDGRTMDFVRHSYVELIWHGVCQYHSYQALGNTLAGAVVLNYHDAGAAGDAGYGIPPRGGIADAGCNRGTSLHERSISVTDEFATLLEGGEDVDYHTCPLNWRQNRVRKVENGSLDIRPRCARGGHGNAPTQAQ